MIRALLALPPMRVRGVLAALPVIILDHARQEKWRVYAGACLQTISENCAKLATGEYIKERWEDVADPKEPDTRTGEEIAADVIERAGLVLVREEEYGTV